MSGCNNCGGTGGHHFNDCSYDGSGSGRGSSGNSVFKWILIVLVILVLAISVGIDTELLAGIFAIPIFVLYIASIAWLFK